MPLRGASRPARSRDPLNQANRTDSLSPSPLHLSLALLRMVDPRWNLQGVKSRCALFLLLLFAICSECRRGTPGAGGSQASHPGLPFPILGSAVPLSILPLSSFAFLTVKVCEVVGGRASSHPQVLTLLLPSCPVRSCSPPSPERSPPPCLPLRQHPALPRQHDTHPLSPPPPPPPQPRPSRRTSVSAAVGGNRSPPLRPKWTTATPSERRATGSARQSSATRRRRTLEGGGRNGRGRWRRRTGRQRSSRRLLTRSYISPLPHFFPSSTHPLLLPTLNHRKRTFN